MQFVRFGLLGLLAWAPFSMAAYKLEPGKTLPPLTISGEHGGNVKDNGAWNSQSMNGTLNFVVYVDPDDSELNDELVNRLQAEKFPEAYFHSVAIINMAATWKPNAIIMSVLRGKQEKFPRTTYVFDKDRYAAQNWSLTPEGYHVLLVDRDGSVLYEKAGKLDKGEIEKFVDLVRSKVKEAEQAPIAKADTQAPADAQKTKKSL
ncbi:MAG TPA: YtfJ family protein [Oligoflexus sp.]|uniref:YtfJ family protein n=1 Tax=Oligoflexus sp. TaxID=1971216 RepID=UPI002D7EB18A|nr:YtfJ family protein [Oligoflexus sp.]HET9241045.1 YtfJ family protein [Oligoflexus sp.]